MGGEEHLPVIPPKLSWRFMTRTLRLHSLSQRQRDGDHQRAEGAWTLQTLAMADVQQRECAAGCHQCHASDLVLDQATVLNTGKEIFRGKGCMGCHRLEGFDAEAEALNTNRQRFGSSKESQGLEKNIELTGKRRTLPQTTRKRSDSMHRQTPSVRRSATSITRWNSSTFNRGPVARAEKGRPQLKEVRVKINKEWIPVWLENLMLTGDNQNARVPIG